MQKTLFIFFTLLISFSSPDLDFFHLLQSKSPFGARALLCSVPSSLIILQDTFNPILHRFHDRLFLNWQKKIEKLVKVPRFFFTRLAQMSYWRSMGFIAHFFRAQVPSLLTCCETRVITLAGIDKTDDAQGIRKIRI